MGITKTGADLRQAFATVASRVGTAYRGIKKLKPVVSIPYKAAKGVGKAGLGVADVIGRGIAKHPKTGLTLGAGALYTANTLPEKFTRNLAHVDPNQHSTYASPFVGKIRMINADPMTNTYMHAQNRIF